MEARNDATTHSREINGRSSDCSACFLARIDRISYADALRMQLRLHEQVAARNVPGVLLLLEHDPVITMGVKTGEGNVLVRPEVLQQRGIQLVQTDRGGDVTYHGPGQLVGYPILRLRELGGDVHSFLRTLEQSIIDVLADYGLEAGRSGQAGVWVGDKKVCSIGIAVRKWVSYHGFALNVDPDMSHFRLINPCGLDSQKMTSLAQLLGRAPSMDDVSARCASAIARNFGLEFSELPADLC